MPDIKPLSSDEWLTLRDIRLSALRESPQAFLSTYATERAFTEDKWRAEFSRGQWNVGFDAGQPVSLVGITREPDMSLDQCYLGYLWVAPRFRRQGTAFRMVDEVLGRLQKSGVRTVFLWVLDGNDSAMRLYQRIGFISSNYRQPLPGQPGRSEERMQLDLSQWQSGNGTHPLAPTRQDGLPGS
jgi:ribosomal protein S18 acetylase RimI-like enzyme